MTDPHQQAAQIWKNAEAFVEHFEQSVRAGRDDQVLLDEMVSRLRSIANAQSVSLIAGDQGEFSTLALSGIAISLADDIPVDNDYQLSASRTQANNWQLKLILGFDEPVPLATRQPLAELCEALLDLAGTVYMRTRLVDLEQRLRARGDQDAWIGDLHDGVGVQDSFAAIAAALASRIAADRVSLMRLQSNRVQWVSSSNQAAIDRRASQVRLLESAVGEVVSKHSKYTVSSDANDKQPALLQAYMDHSGCRQIHIESVPESDAIIVLERFSADDDSETLGSQLDPLRASIQSAVVKAAKRDHADWAQIAGHLSKSIKRSNAVTIAIGAVLVLAASVLIKVPLMIPVNGMVTAMEASRIYAPAEGIVEEVLVADGDTVSRGMPLVRLRSPELDLQQRALEGAMMTAQNRLDSLQIARTDGRFSADNDQNLSADDKVLRTEIKGLQKQLELIQAQQAALLITSPIDGHVDGWDLQNSLQARPVAVGQLLLNVISEPAGWKVQLDVPDQNVGYLLQHQSVENCRVRFRLRSDATVVHEGKIDTIADSAQLDPQGNSIVRATLPFIAQGDVSIREGATVVAQVDCGKHSVGFVWLRGLIEWWRTSWWL